MYVEGVERSSKWSYTCLLKVHSHLMTMMCFFLSSCANSYIGDNATYLWQYAYNVKNLCHCHQVRMDPYNFLNIQLIFNPKKVLKSWDIELFNTIKCYVCWILLEVSKVKITFDTSNMLRHRLVLQIENPLNIKKVMSKNMCMFFQHLRHA